MGSDAAFKMSNAYSEDGGWNAADAIYASLAGLEPGDVILVESPTFVHAVQTFKMFQAQCIACETDDHGLVLEDVEKKIRQLKRGMKAAARVLDFEKAAELRDRIKGLQEMIVF